MYHRMLFHLRDRKNAKIKHFSTLPHSRIFHQEHILHCHEPYMHHAVEQINSNILFKFPDHCKIIKHFLNPFIITCMSLWL